MAMKPWYKVITPREDLRDGKPLDASEFAVHLDHVRDGRAPAVYQKPDQFFERTFLTANLGTRDAGRPAAVGRQGRDVGRLQSLDPVRRRQDARVDAALPPRAHGEASKDWKGVRGILENAGVPTVPKAATAVFVGTEFDSITGRGGHDGTPLRKTPWGEIAFQLGGGSASGWSRSTRRR